MFVFFALQGCKVVDAPDSLEEVMVYAFTNYDESDSYLEAAEENLLALVATQEAELATGYRVNDLTAENLAAAGVDAGDLEGIIGAMGLVDYTSAIDDVVEAVSATNKSERWPDNFDTFEVTDSSDRPCFLAGDCDRLDQTVHEVANLVAPVNSAERTYDVSFRWIQAADQPQAVFIRQLSPDPVNVGWDAMAIHQQYSLVMLWQDGNATRRVEAFWVDAEFIGIDIPDTFAVDSAVSQMGKQAENVDNWIDEN